MDEQSLLPANIGLDTRGFLRKNKLPIISVIVFLLGLLLGSFAISLSSGGDFFGILPLVRSSITSRESSPFYVTFLSSAAVSLSLILLMFISSLSAFGWLFCPMILLARGFCTGLIAGCLYRQYALYGIGYFALIMLIPCFILTYTLIFACCDGMRFSFRIFASVFMSMPQQIRLTKQYALRYLIYTAFCIVSSLSDAVLSACFINFFSF
ncbi:MAG: stage II sporulation protein M [Acutalibacteraceae bacterium]